MHTKLHFLISCYDNCKNTVLFVTMTTLTQGGKSLFIYTQIQNIKLINSPIFKSNWLLFLKIKCHKESILHWLLMLLGIATGRKDFERDKDFKFSFYSILLDKNLLHAISDCWVWIILLYFLKLCWQPPE